jgi:hypothetical protein
MCCGLNHLTWIIILFRSFITGNWVCINSNAFLYFFPCSTTLACYRDRISFVILIRLTHITLRKSHHLPTIIYRHHYSSYCRYRQDTYIWLTFWLSLWRGSFEDTNVHAVLVIIQIFLHLNYVCNHRSNYSMRILPIIKKKILAPPAESLRFQTLAYICHLPSFILLPILNKFFLSP